MAKNDIFGQFEFTKIWFHVNLSGSKIIKFQQSQALSSFTFWEFRKTKFQVSWATLKIGLNSYYTQNGSFDTVKSTRLL